MVKWRVTAVGKQTPQEHRSNAGKQAVNRRLQARMAIDCQVCLCWQDRRGNQILRARALDVSKFGMLVETERPIAPGVVVSVERDSSRLGGACVRHCTPHGIKYRIGLHMPDRMTSLMVSTQSASY